MALLVQKFGGTSVGSLERIANVARRVQANRRSTTKLLCGRGGGRPDMAQAGGSDPSRVEQALDSVPAWVTNQLAS